MSVCGPRGFDTRIIRRLNTAEDYCRVAEEGLWLGGLTGASMLVLIKVCAVVI
jgi:hypothetical protein